MRANCKVNCDGYDQSFQLCSPLQEPFLGLPAGCEKENLGHNFVYAYICICTYIHTNKVTCGIYTFIFILRDLL